MRIALLLIFMFSASVCCALETTPELDIQPSELLKTATKWKLDTLQQQLKDEAGQHAVFYEIMSLYEKQPDSRSDTGLELIMDSLLFKSGLSNDWKIVAFASTKLPPFNEKLGVRYLEKRVTKWVNAGLSLGISNLEPWTWNDFLEIDSKSLASATRNVRASFSKNPLADLWLSLLLIACDAQEGDDLAVLACGKDFNKRLLRIMAIGAMAQRGVKCVLPLLAKAAVADQGAWESLFQSFGWDKQLPWGWKSNIRSPEQVEKISAWLSRNLAELKWDAQNRIYTSPPPPGLETLYAAAQAVDTKWHSDFVYYLKSKSKNLSSLSRDLLGKMEHDAGIASDPNATTLFLTMLTLQDSNYVEAQSVDRVFELNQSLALKLWCRQSTALLQSGDGAQLFLGGFDFRSLPRFKKLLEFATKEDDISGTLTCELTCIWLGKRADKHLLLGLLRKSPEAMDKGGSGKFWLWTRMILSAKRVNGLRLLLIAATLNLDSYNKFNRTGHPLDEFVDLCWSDSRDVSLQGTPSEILQRAEEWLNKNEYSLKYQDGKFVGDLSPGRSSISDAFKDIPEKYALPVNEAVENSEYIALFNELIALMKSNAEARNDRGCGNAVVALLEPAKVFEDEDRRTKALIEFPQLNHDYGVKIWASYLRTFLGRPDIEGIFLADLDKKVPGYEQQVFMDSRALLLDEVKTRFESREANNPADALWKAFAFIYVGGQMPPDDLKQMFLEAKKSGRVGPGSVSMWGTAIAKTESVAGLDILLYAIEHWDDHYPCQCFDTLTERTGESKRETYINWMNENRQALKWDLKRRRFVLLPPLPKRTIPVAPEPTTPVKPPKPKGEDF